MRKYISVYGTLALVALGAVGLYFLVIRVADDNYQRELHYWESRLAITADMRTTRVEGWINNFQQQIESIAENESVKLDMTMLPERSKSDFEEAKTDYLYNYLTVMAEQGDFLENSVMQGIGANIRQEGSEGVALVNLYGGTIVATRSFPKIDRKIENALATIPNSTTLLPYISDDSGWQKLVVIVPVYAIQSESPVGWVVGHKLVDEQLYSGLDSPKMTEKTVETYLTRSQDGAIDYLTPLATESLPVRRSGDVDAAQIFHNNGLVNGQNYADTNVLTIGREIAPFGWRLVQSIHTEEALKSASEQRAQFIVSGILGLLTLLFIVFGLWRHGSSVRFKRLAYDFGEQKKLLRLIMDHQPDAMFILDKKGSFYFTNMHLPIYDDIRDDDIIGKPIQDVLGAAYAKPYQEKVLYALEHKQVISNVRHVTRNEKTLCIQTKYIPLSSVPQLSGSGTKHAVLVVEQDITSTIKANEKQRTNLKKIVETLAKIVDDRDQHYADHSNRVAEHAQRVAEEMGLDSAHVDATYIAGLLLNFGRVMLPRELFQKETKLTVSEKTMLADAYRMSAEYLQGIAFDGPVQDTILQSQERIDGTGPLKLSGDKILQTARILRVCNDYVAMASPRSYRDAMSTTDAENTLMKSIDSVYDRNAVITLLHCLQQNN